MKRFYSRYSLHLHQICQKLRIVVLENKNPRRVSVCKCCCGGILPSVFVCCPSVDTPLTFSGRVDFLLVSMLYCYWLLWRLVWTLETDISWSRRRPSECLLLSTVISPISFIWKKQWTDFCFAELRHRDVQLSLFQMFLLSVITVDLVLRSGLYFIHLVSIMWCGQLSVSVIDKNVTS